MKLTWVRSFSSPKLNFTCWSIKYHLLVSISEWLLAAVLAYESLFSADQKINLFIDAEDQRCLKMWANRSERQISNWFELKTTKNKLIRLLAPPSSTPLQFEIILARITHIRSRLKGMLLRISVRCLWSNAKEYKECLYGNASAKEC